jgi:hypothetical protein
MDTDAGQGAQLTATQIGEARAGDDAQPHAADDARIPAPAADFGAERLARDAGDEVEDEVEDEDDRPTVESHAWLKRDDYWQRTTYIAVTGRHTATAPQTRPLPRPRRFRKPAPVRSVLILALTLALIVVIPLGVVMAQRAGETQIKLPTSIPGLTQPTATHTATHTPVPTATIRPTATPKSKKN